jgi:glucose/arabinose dehydrogenase
VSALRAALLLAVTLVSTAAASAGSGVPDPAALPDLVARSSSGRSVVAIALHPAFATNARVYVLWTETIADVETLDVFAPPVLGQRVDRFVWNGSDLVLDQTIIRFRAFESDRRRSASGGAIRFGGDGKLYVRVGGVGRRGWTQNLPNGPLAGGPDIFGGPAIEDADLTDIVVRLNDDGSAPEDNPFFAIGSALGGEVGANLQKIDHSNGRR